MTFERTDSTSREQRHPACRTASRYRIQRFCKAGKTYAPKRVRAAGFETAPDSNARRHRANAACCTVRPRARRTAEADGKSSPASPVSFVLRHGSQRHSPLLCNSYGRTTNSGVACREFHDLAGCDIHLRARKRIAPGTGLALRIRKEAEAENLHRLYRPEAFR